VSYAVQLASLGRLASRLLEQLPVQHLVCVLCTRSPLTSLDGGSVQDLVPLFFVAGWFN